MLDCYVMLDLETTGGNAVQDRITEIAAVRIENGQETARWSTLVNPGLRIPPFIQQLTGITDAMVAQAPHFADVADTLTQLLDGAVLVAHNVRFDHGFLLNELARLDRPLKVKTLCTVRLSRKLYPQFKGHGLDALLQRHGLQTQSRHRAMGDVEVVLEWLKLVAAELGADTVRRAALELLQGSAAMPPQLETPVADIPDTPGVYLFYGEGKIPIYVGKSVKMRTRVLSHFQSAAKVAREMRILTEIRRIEWRETAGELGALLLESRLIKELQPIHNRQLRRERNLLTWHMPELQADMPHDKLPDKPPEKPLALAKPLLHLLRMDDLGGHRLDSAYGVYRSKRQALDTLRELAEMHKLCPQWLGLESGKGPCFAFQIGQCKGACAGHEAPALLRVRLQLALAEHRLRAWPFSGKVAIREYDAATGRTDLHVFDQWCHLCTVHDEAELAQASTSRQTLAFDLDTYRLLLKRLSSQSTKEPSFFVLNPAPVDSPDAP